jgi:hypothetical protein
MDRLTSGSLGCHVSGRRVRVAACVLDLCVGVCLRACVLSVHVQ